MFWKRGTQTQSQTRPIVIYSVIRVARLFTSTNGFERVLKSFQRLAEDYAERSHNLMNADLRKSRTLKTEASFADQNSQLIKLQLEGVSAMSPEQYGQAMRTKYKQWWLTEGFSSAR